MASSEHASSRGHLTTVRLRVRKHPAKGDPQKEAAGFRGVSKRAGLLIGVSCSGFTEVVFSIFHESESFYLECIYEMGGAAQRLLAVWEDPKACRAASVARVMSYDASC